MIVNLKNENEYFAAELTSIEYIISCGIKLITELWKGFGSKPVPDEVLKL